MEKIDQIEQLQTDIETALSMKLKTPKDFEYLRERLFARQHVVVSVTTLKRLWGYVREDVSPRLSTLNTLSQFIGYKDWNEYQNNSLLPKEQQSSPVLTRRLSVNSSLFTGDRLRIFWQPDRVCEVEYLGELKFIVLDSKNTRLKKDDTFECSIIIEGEPLYLDNLCQSGLSPVAYVCGKKSGVMFEFIK
jgi:hypothetical protein